MVNQNPLDRVYSSAAASPSSLSRSAKLMTPLRSKSRAPRRDRADRLHAKTGGIVILEYQVHGTVLATGAPYNNRFVSVITVSDRRSFTGEITWTLSRLGML
jgi:hypothetical protein